MNIESKASQEELALHECGHAIVVRLFKRYIKLERIIADNNGNDEILAANSIKGFYHEGSKSVAAMGMALVAGVVADTISKEGAETVQQKKEDYLLQPARLNWRLGAGDERLFKTNVDHFVMMYQCDGTKYIRFCIELTIDFLTNPIVWEYLWKLSVKLLSKPDLMLEEKELDDFFEECKFDLKVNLIEETITQRIVSVEAECSVEVSTGALE